MIQKCDYIIIREFGISKTVTDTEFSVTYELVNDEVYNTIIVVLDFLCSLVFV